MYSKVLVPLDGSKFGERAIPQAEEIGQATKAEIILSQEVQSPIRSVPIPAGQKEETKAMKEAEDKAGSYLEKVASPLKVKGIKVRCAIAVGEPKGEIPRKVHKEDVDLIVMSTHNEGDLYKSVVGSVAEKVLRSIPVSPLPTGDQSSVANEYLKSRWLADPLLHGEPFREQANQPRELGEADDLLVGDVPYESAAVKRKRVVFAEAEELDRPSLERKDHLFYRSMK